MKTIKLIRTYTTVFTFNVDTTTEAVELFNKITDDEKYSKELEQMDVDEIVKVVDDTFAKKCDFSGEGMNDGWVFGDGDKYAKYRGDAEFYSQQLGYNSLEDAYDDMAVYWTEWNDESDYQYKIINGKLTELI